MTSFGDVVPVSVSRWASLKPQKEIMRSDLDQRVTRRSKMELFSARGQLMRSSNVLIEDISNLSFYAFWRLFEVKGNKIARRRGDKRLNGVFLSWRGSATRLLIWCSRTPQRDYPSSIAVPQQVVLALSRWASIKIGC